MTNDEIVKALECCMGCDCKECPYDGDAEIDAEVCMGKLIVEALKLVNRQKAEIDRFADIGKMYSEVRAEAIKEFAGRLKENADVYDDDEYYFHFVTTEDIDNLVKEMTEETK